MLTHKFRPSAYGAARVNAVRDALSIQFCPERVQLEVNFPYVNGRDLLPLKAQSATCVVEGYP
jgi:hypothetical protein